MRKTFVLIHGTWHAGWAWQKVMHYLRAKDHVAHAPTLAGHGLAAVRPGIKHQDCVDSVAAYIRRQELNDVVLVGHSFGGTVIQKVAEQLPDRTARLVFLDALILKDNECVFDVLPEVFLESLAPKNGICAQPVSENSKEALSPPPWETWRDNFIQDAPQTLARSTWKQLSPEPSQVNLDKVHLNRFGSLDISRSFIFCRQDRAMPQGYFHPGMSSRLGTCKLVEMDGSHEVMFTRPRDLAEKIVEASSE